VRGQNKGNDFGATEASLRKGPKPSPKKSWAQHEKGAGGLAAGSAQGLNKGQSGWSTEAREVGREMAQAEVSGSAGSHGPW
jgi:hypothetical protein